MPRNLDHRVECVTEVTDPELQAPGDAVVRIEATGDDRLLAEGWGALVGYDYTAGSACPLPDVLVTALQADGAAAAA